MKKKIIYELNALYREPMQVMGYVFGEGEKSVCVVGSMRGNEVQQADNYFRKDFDGRKQFCYSLAEILENLGV